MKTRKNWLTVVLMISSIVLLISLQVVWLRSLFKDVKRDLRREVSMIFSSTVMAMQDSILEKNIKPLPGDSTAEIFGNVAAIRDTVKFKLDKDAGIRMPDHREDVVYFSTTRVDSVRKFFRPLMMKFRTNRKQRGYVMQITLDSLKPEAIKKNYANELKKSGIVLPFSIQRTKDREPHKDNGSSITTEPFPFFQRESFYVARFSDVTIFIWGKLVTQLLFSAFLTSLTLAAFYLMYRSIISNQRLLEIKNDFIGNMTHELKTPIATVSVALESLKNFNVLENPQRATEYLDMAQQELNRLSILTDKVLKTAIFESNGLTLQYEKVDLKKVVNHVIDSMKLVFEKHKTKLTYEKKGVDFILDGSNDHLTNVIYNLLDNAQKYSKQNPSIEIDLKSDENQIIFSIHDHGGGIAPQHQRRIFEKFYRVPTGDVANTKGYGLGLSYVRHIVNLHHGEINVQSTLGEGATFTVTLPRKAK